MRKFIYKIILTTLSFLLPLVVTAEPPQDYYNAPDKRYLKEFCPPVEDLYQNEDLTWSAPGGWKSSNPSFMRSLHQFIGAQWVGVNVGDVICLYVKGGRADFPVTLQKQIVTMSPTGGKWTEDKGGHKDCNSNEINQCGFEEQIRRNTETLYGDLDFHKGKPTQDLN